MVPRPRDIDDDGVAFVAVAVFEAAVAVARFVMVFSSCTLVVRLLLGR